MSAPDEFDRIIHGMGISAPAETIDPQPYGTPTRPGLTARGKAALGLGAAVIAGGGLIGYQMHAATEAKEREIDLKAQALELAKLKETNRASEVNRVAQDTGDKARQASVNACIKTDKQLVGKGMGSPSYREVIESCQSQYAATNVGEMETVSAATNTIPRSGEGGSSGPLLGVAALALGIAAFSWKSKKTNPA